MAAVLLFLPAVAFGQEHGSNNEVTVAPRCRAFPEMVDWLRRNFSEVGVAHGLSANGELLEVFASLEGTFTAVKITPQGDACIVDLGVGWQMQHSPLDGAALDGRGYGPF